MAQTKANARKWSNLWNDILAHDYENCARCNRSDVNRDMLDLAMQKIRKTHDVEDVASKEAIQVMRQGMEFVKSIMLDHEHS